MTEAELAAVVVAYLESQKADVYQEVQMHTGGGIADIVAKTGPALHVVETKLCLSLTLMAQAFDWLPYSHFVSVCIPEPIHGTGYKARRPRHEGFSRVALRHFGIGLMYVKTRGCDDPEVDVIVKPEMRRPRLAYRLAECLVPQQKTFAKAGSPNGSAWTPYQQTCLALAEFVAKHPGASLREGVEAIRHHYTNDKSAIASLRKWLEQGSVRGVCLVADGRHLTLQPLAPGARADEPGEG
jgi:hypothetical protein